MMRRHLIRVFEQLIIIGLLCALGAAQVEAVTAGSNQVSQELDLKEQTRVSRSVFSVLIPKGWSYEKVIESAAPGRTRKHSEGWILATPTPKLRTSEVSLGVNVVVPLASSAFDEFVRNRKNDSKLYKKNWGGMKWEVVEYSTQNDGVSVRQWYAVTHRSKMDLMVLARIPEKQIAEFQNAIFGILESIQTH